MQSLALMGGRPRMPSRLPNPSNTISFASSGWFNTKHKPQEEKRKLNFEFMRLALAAKLLARSIGTQNYLTAR